MESVGLKGGGGGSKRTLPWKTLNPLATSFSPRQSPSPSSSSMAPPRRFAPSPPGPPSPSHCISGDPNFYYPHLQYLLQQQHLEMVANLKSISASHFPHHNGLSSLALGVPAPPFASLSSSVFPDTFFQPLYPSSALPQPPAALSQFLPPQQPLPAMMTRGMIGGYNEVLLEAAASTLGRARLAVLFLPSTATPPTTTTTTAAYRKPPKQPQQVFQEIVPWSLIDALFEPDNDSSSSSSSSGHSKKEEEEEEDLLDEAGEDEEKDGSTAAPNEESDAAEDSKDIEINNNNNIKSSNYSSSIFYWSSWEGSETVDSFFAAHPHLKPSREFFKD
ncbi:hypothetical protein TYRP_018209 [Tyrophagus putrescentiae]|nr:hypothetical protein TYRP_018209 [Tyrophagus putrescentiae]